MTQRYASMQRMFKNLPPIFFGERDFKPMKPRRIKVLGPRNKTKRNTTRVSMQMRFVLVLADA